MSAPMDSNESDRNDADRLASKSSEGMRVARCIAWGILPPLVAGLLYFQTLHYEFVWDDWLNITMNRGLETGSLEDLGKFWSEPYAKLYIPVTYSWFFVESAISRACSLDAQDARVFHAGNILLHAISGVLVFLILRILVPGNLAACAGALLFVVHPIQVEPVSWVTGSKDLLSGCLALAALHQYLLFARRRPPWIDPSSSEFNPDTTEPTVSTKLRATHYVFAVVLGILAMLAKPSAVAVPIIAGGIDLLLFRRRWFAVGASLMPWIACAGAIVLVTQDQQSTGLFVDAVSPSRRPLVASDALSFYWAKVVVPLDMTVDHGRRPATIFEQGWAWWTWILPVGLLIAAAILPGRRYWLVGLGIFTAALGPVLGLVPFEFQEVSTVADRYAYLAMLGPALLLAYWLSRFQRKLPAVVVAVGLLVLAISSYRQTPRWHDQKALFQHALDVNENSFLAHLNLGNEAKTAGDAKLAEAHYRRAFEIRSDYSPAYCNLGVLLLELDRSEDAIPLFRASIKYAPHQAKLYNNLGNALQRQGEFDAALLEFEKAARLFPELPTTYFNMGNLYRHRRDWISAQESFEKAIEIEPRFLAAHLSLASLLAERGFRDQAIAHYRAALEIQPESTEAQLGLADLRARPSR
jgi:tetratricopeptide (TPR) repeat protein